MKSRESETTSTTRGIGRRGFLKAVPAAVAAGLAVPALAKQAPATPAAAPQGAPQAPPGRIGKDALKAAEQIPGLTFTDPEEDMMLPGVNLNLTSFETLRKIDIPLDTEPAITFRPYLPGKRPKPGVRQKTPRIATPMPAVRVNPSSLDALAFLPVTTLSRLIATRQVSSLDLTKMYLERLKRYGEKLKCVVTLTEDLALQQAAAADKEIRAGKSRGPLHGIPWGAKDLFATKGIRTTWGAKPYENQVVDYDATIVERLREAGAVLVAKLSMGALAMGGDWFGGQTKNPWKFAHVDVNPSDPADTSSGSSAGPASATSAGLVGFGVGTETRGSIISPSSTCGVVGLRPTYGRVSRYGAMALSWTMDKVGPICRSVEDCALVFNAIYGSDGRDETVVDAAFDWVPDVPLAKLKIAYLKSEFEPQAPRATVATPPANPNLTEDQRKQMEAQREARRKLMEAQRTIMADALDVFRKLGVTLQPVELPDFPANAINFILNAEGAAAFDDLTRSKGIDQLTAQSRGDWPNTFRTNRFVPAVEYIRAQRARTLLMRKMDAMMQQCDVFLSPTGSGSLGITNLTGHPAMCLKAGFAAENQPVALMITGRLYDEATLLRAGLAFEQATKWQGMNPKVT
jgi:Asp-tRNA(Asn)/Glu-tRNA(Gln) amidotransferase A subunit family amidase